MIHHRSGDIEIIKRRYQDSKNIFISHYFDTGIDAWTFNCNNYYINNFDSGIMAMTTLYYLATECPVSLKIYDFKNLRLQFAYWLMNEMLPL